MKLELGKRYITRNGIKTTPLVASKNGTNYVFGATVQELQHPDPSCCAWLEDGSFLHPNSPHTLDLIKEA